MSNPSGLTRGVAFGELVRATEGLTQWRPLLVGFASLLVSSLMMSGAFAAAASIRGNFGMVLALVIALLALVVVLGGFSAVGILLMDKARNIPPRTVGSALVMGVLCIPRFLLFALMLLALSVVVGVVAALLYLVCKIPFVGAVLAFFVHPIMVLVAAFLIVAVMFVAIPLFAPAVWAGLTFRQALTSLVAIAKKRLVHVVLMLIVLQLIVLVVSTLLFAGLVPAAAGMTTLAMGILSQYGSYGVDIGSLMMGSLAGLFMGGGMPGSGAVAAAMAGLGVLFLVLGALMAQVGLMGFNLMYVQAADGIDLSETSESLDKLVKDLKDRAETAKDSAVAAAARAQQAAAERMEAAKAAQQAKAQAAAEAQAQAQAQAAQAEAAEASATVDEAASAPAAKPAQTHCPACEAVVQPGDMFCGECGHKLG